MSASGSDPGPKTVIRPPGGRPTAAPAGDPIAALASPVIDFASALARARKPDPVETATELRRLLGQFEQAAQRAGLRPEAVLDARDALITLVDARARSNPALGGRAWARALAAAVPTGAGAGAQTLRQRADAAARAGPAGRDLARLLRHCLEASEAARPTEAAAGGLAGAAWAALLVLVFLGLIGWAGWVEWRYRELLLAQLPDGAAMIAAAAEATPAERLAALDAMAAASDDVARAAPNSPLRLVHWIPQADPAATARQRYAALADAVVPAPLWAALGTAIATEGDPEAVYDTLRARSILAGDARWQPGFLAGWITDRAAAMPDLAGLARHVGALSGPAAPPGPEDADSLADAQAIAAEGGAAERAFLELRRAPSAGALPAWHLAAAVPGLDSVLVRRSGRPLTEGIDGLYTAAGWAQARDGAAAAAIAQAETEARRLIAPATEEPGALARRPAAAEGTVRVEDVLALLQIRTLDIWSAYLADLRVKPFTDQPGALMISGALAVGQSPLSALIREVWRQTGGEDRTRPHPDQMRVAVKFGPAIQFVEQGGMAAVSRLFAGLNVALAVLEADDDLGEQRLMGVQAQAISIATLQQAPTLVVQIIEDVLAQTAAANPSLGRRQEPLDWQRRIASACTAGVAGRYPFAEGPDADPVELAGLFGGDGLVARFFHDRLAPLMDMSESPWRWKPAARLSGFSADSAAFFERVAELGAVYFPAGTLATAPFSIEALAQHGSARVALGGSETPVDIGEPARLQWPGPEPGQGFSVTFASGEQARAAGPWGLLRVLDGLHLRRRDDGQRFRVDVRLAGVRVYLELIFETAANPISRRPLLAGLHCPATL